MEDIDGVIYDYIRTTKESFFSDYLFRFWLIRRTSSTIRDCITNVSTEGWCDNNITDYKYFQNDTLEDVVKRKFAIIADNFLITNSSL